MEQNSPFDQSIGFAETVIEPTHSWLNLQLRDIWQYRELLFFLVWRDIKVRYKQTALGVTWIVLQPLVSMLVFTVLFGILLQAPSGEAPYPLFVLAGLLPWTYFSGALNRASTSVVDSANLITKVFFPRLVVPLAAVLSGLVDFGVSFLVFGLLLLFYQTAPTPAVLLLPLFLLLAMITALGFGLWLSALNVRYRDVKQLIPFILQIWMYLTPVVYSVTLIPEKYRWLLALNPMTGVVEGFRWALLGGEISLLSANKGIVAVSALIAIGALISGVIYFRRTERFFADII